MTTQQKALAIILGIAVLLIGFLVYKSATMPKTEGELSNSSVNTGQCYIGGCSSQICSDQKDLASTCEWKPQYACYQGGICERQTDGKCGWRQTSELTACLNTDFDLLSK